MTDRAQELFDHAKTLTPEQMPEFMKSLPKEDQLLVAMKAIETIGNISAHLVQNADEIWETKEINCPELCTHQPGKYYECVKCGESFPRKYYS